MIPQALYLAGKSQDFLNVDMLYRIETMVEGNKPEEEYFVLYFKYFSKNSITSGKGNFKNRPNIPVFYQIG